MNAPPLRATYDRDADTLHFYVAPAAKSVIAETREVAPRRAPGLRHRGPVTEHGGAECLSSPAANCNSSQRIGAAPLPHGVTRDGLSQHP